VKNRIIFTKKENDDSRDYVWEWHGEKKKETKEKNQESKSKCMSNKS
jgi:hypothetical protein